MNTSVYERELALQLAVRQVRMPSHSDGPFCRVEFFIGRDGLQAYTYRGAVYAESRGTQVNVICSLCDGGPRFNEVFIATDCVSITREVLG